MRELLDIYDFDWTPGNRLPIDKTTGRFADFTPSVSFRKQTPVLKCRAVRYSTARMYCHKWRVSAKLNSSIVITHSDWILVHFRVIVIVEHVYIIACM